MLINIKKRYEKVLKMKASFYSLLRYFSFNYKFNKKSGLLLFKKRNGDAGNKGSLGESTGVEKLFKRRNDDAGNEGSSEKSTGPEKSAGKPGGKVEKIKTVVVGVAGSALSTGGEAIKKTAGAMRNFSLMLIVLGLVHFLLRFGQAQLSASSFIFSLFLFILSGYALSQAADKDRMAILIPMLLFSIWYFIFKAAISGPIAITMLSISIGLIGLPLILTKGKSGKAEALGLLPILFFFLDLGLLPFLAEKLNLVLAPAAENLLIFVPWWVVLGIFILPTEGLSGFSGFIIVLLKAAGIFLVVISFVMPAIPNWGHVTTLLPSVGQLQEAQVKVQERFAGKENPFISSFACISDFENYQGCIDKRQQEAAYRNNCRLDKDVKEGRKTVDECIIEIKEKEKQQLSVASGAVDPTIKLPTAFEFRIDEQFFPKKASVESGPLVYIANLDYKNPRQQEIKIDFTCRFTKKGEETFLGEITTAKSITVSDVAGTESVFCQPPAGKALNGRYDLVFNATLHNLVSRSRLTRFFIGKKTNDEKSEIISELEKIEGKSLNSFSDSLAPADPTVLIFGLGNSPKDPIISSNKNVILALGIQDSRKGKVEKINHYELFLPGVTGSCLVGDNIPLGSASEANIWNSGCLVNLPPEFAEIENFRKEEFESMVDYDYLITKKIMVEVEGSAQPQLES